MQNAVAERWAQDDTLSLSATASLRRACAVGATKPRAAIEVTTEDECRLRTINEPDPVFCQNLLEFLRDFESAAPKSSAVPRPGRAARTGPIVRDPFRYDVVLIEFLRDFETARAKLIAPSLLRPTGAPLNTIVTGAPPIVTPTITQPLDAPFRVPPYVAGLSKRPAKKKALLDPDASRREPRRSAAPVAPTLAPLPPRPKPLVCRRQPG